MREPLIDVDPSKVLGVRRTGVAGAAYLRLLRGDPCSYCFAPAGGYREIDHIHARSFGGENRWHNYTAACGFCNVAKSNDSALIWLLRFAVEWPAFVREYMQGNID